MSGHDLFTLIVRGVCRNDNPEAEVENHGYNVAMGPMYKFGAECCGRTGRINVENTASEFLSPEQLLILQQEGEEYHEVSSTEWTFSIEAEIASRREQIFDDEPDPCETLSSRAGNCKRRRLRRPSTARIAIWMIQGSNHTQPKVNPPWVNPKTMTRFYITP